MILHLPGANSDLYQETGICDIFGDIRTPGQGCICNRCETLSVGGFRRFLDKIVCLLVRFGYWYLRQGIFGLAGWVGRWACLDMQVLCMAGGLRPKAHSAGERRCRGCAVSGAPRSLIRPKHPHCCGAGAIRFVLWPVMLLSNFAPGGLIYLAPAHRVHRCAPPAVGFHSTPGAFAGSFCAEVGYTGARRGL